MACRCISLPEAVSGQERGLEGQLRLSLTSSLPGGTVSMATCSGTRSSLKMPWRYTRRPVSGALTEWVGEKGSGQRANAAQGPVLPGGPALTHLSSSVRARGGSTRVHHGLSGSSLDCTSPHCSL